MLNPREYCFGCMQPLPEPDAKCPCCGWDNSQRKNAPEQLPFALLAKKYIVGRALGRGGFGITYVGLNEQLGRRVAIKEYYPEDIAARGQDSIHVIPSSPEFKPQLQEGMRKALEEARTIAHVQSIPHVVRIFDCFGRNDTVYIVMEFIEGETLRERVEKKGGMSWKDAWAVMKPIGTALGVLHRQKLIHRDISPDNIMISHEDGTSVLLDFGASSSMFQEGEKHDRLLKDGYAAFEQYQECGQIDGRSDEYAWAATFLYTLTGKNPPNAVQRQFQDETIIWKHLKRDVPSSAKEALMKAMAVNPEERFDSMELLIEAIDESVAEPAHGRGFLIAAAVTSAAVAAGSVAIGLLGG